MLQKEQVIRTLAFSQVKTAAERLEATYIIKLFAEFEGILRADLIASRPGRRLRRTPTETVINSVALRRRIPDTIRDQAHLVRIYRNFLAHPSGETATILSMKQCVSYLSHFLAWLPNPP